MSLVPILLVVVVVILAIYFALNRSSVEKDREGYVKDILSKDAFAIDFGDGQNVVVKLAGISPAAEREMLDDKIFPFLDENLRGKQVSVKPISVESSAMMTAQVRTMAGEYVNAALVRQGFARWQASVASGDMELAEAQQLAQADQLGVWNPAIIQLLEDRRNSTEASDLSDDDLANQEFDPEEPESKG